MVEVIEDRGFLMLFSFEMISSFDNQVHANKCLYTYMYILTYV